MKRDISNSEDILDSRDIIERINELERERDNWQEDNELPDYIPGDSEKDLERIKAEKWTDEQSDKWTEWDESEEGEELKALLKLQDEAEGYASDWIYGATLIRKTYFVEYCKDLVNDIGDMPKNLPGYIENNINWQGVADDLEIDYTEVDYDGVEYLVR